MKFRFFAIPARQPEEAEQALNAFCASHRVSFVDRRLVEDGADSFWTVCVTWQDGDGGPHRVQGRKSAIDYKQVLNEVDFGRFVALRNLPKHWPIVMPCRRTRCSATSNWPRW